MTTAVDPYKSAGALESLSPSAQGKEDPVTAARQSILANRSGEGATQAAEDVRALGGRETAAVMLRSLGHAAGLVAQFV